MPGVNASPAWIAVAGSRRVTGSLRRPPALRPGDRVALLSVSGLVQPERLTATVDRLAAAGLEAVVFPSARADGSFRRYLAGPDAQRADDLAAAVLDDSVRAVLFGRGGYGAQRTLEHVDWTRFAAVEPKVFVGFSDVTAIHEAVAVELGWASLHGPLVASNGPPGDDSWESLLGALMHPEHSTVLRFPEASAAVGGRATGVTTGGNLAMLASSIGTPTSRPARGRLLLLEDVDEDDYRVDRMLTQLRRSGYLDGVAGIVCGSWLRCGGDVGVEHVLRERLGDLGVPLLLGADVGHGARNLTFPLGVRAELDADAGTVTFVDPPLQPAAI